MSDLVAVFIFSGLLAFALWSGIQMGLKLQERATVHAWDHALLFVNGERVGGPLAPGRYRITRAGAPFGAKRQVVRLPARELETVTGAQAILTADVIQVKAVAAIAYEVEDPVLALAAAAPSAEQMRSDYVIEQRLSEGVYRDAQLALRDVVGSRALEALLADRAALDAALAEAMADSFAPRGLKATRVAVRDVIMGASMRRGYEAAEAARVEGQAALERARAETATLRSLANAARLTRDNPALLSLRLIQTLEREGTKGLTVVLGQDAMASAFRQEHEPGGPEAASDPD